MIDYLESSDAPPLSGHGSDASSTTDGSQDSIRRAAYLTIGFGIAHSILLLVAFWLLRIYGPSLDALDEEIVTYYSDAGNRRIVLLAGIYLIPFASISFIWFIVALRMWASHSVSRASVLFANVQLVSGILYIGLLLAAGAAVSIPAASSGLSDGSLDPDFARQFPQYGVTLFMVLAMRMAAMYVFSTTSLFRTSGLLPAWFIFPGIGVGLALLLTATVNPWLVVVFPTWLLTLCLILLHRVRAISRDLATPARIPAPLP